MDKANWLRNNVNPVPGGAASSSPSLLGDYSQAPDPDLSGGTQKNETVDN